MANTTYSVSNFANWYRKLSQKELILGAVGSALILYSCSFIFNSENNNTNINTNTNTNTNTPIFDFTNNYVPLTLLQNAQQRGAFCLDGSLPGYHFSKGFGSGSSNWVLHIEGGGWCESVATCSFRKTTALGSSNHMEQEVLFSGILSHDHARNPDFFNWNKVKIRYCDGGSFSGHPESEFHNGTNLFFRGQLIWDAVMDELLAKGLNNAHQALLSGCSAGGLTTMIHCDDFRSKLPKTPIVKCLADASFFLDEEDVSGRRTMQLFYKNVVNLHVCVVCIKYGGSIIFLREDSKGAIKSLPEDCVSKMDPALCFFPKQIIQSIKTPLFLVNPAYDFWQIQHVLVPSSSHHLSDWRMCRLNIKRCNSHQMEKLQGFRNSLLNAVDEFAKSKERGMFINSCFSHCQTWMETWHGPNSPKVNNKSMLAIGTSTSDKLSKLIVNFLATHLVITWISLNLDINSFDNMDTPRRVFQFV